MTLYHVIEKFTGNVNQVLIIEATVKSRDDVMALDYDDFTADLWISENGARTHIAEISDLLAKAGVWEDLIDGVNWDQIYCETKAEAA